MVLLNLLPRHLTSLLSVRYEVYDVVTYLVLTVDL